MRAQIHYYQQSYESGTHSAHIENRRRSGYKLANRPCNKKVIRVGEPTNRIFRCRRPRNRQG